MQIEIRCSVRCLLIGDSQSRILLLTNIILIFLFSRTPIHRRPVAMHFWIDKRSQSCGFGRSRVAASLSGGSGIGFGHHPRRLGGKQMMGGMGGLPIHHRYPPVEYRSAASSSSASRQPPHHNGSHNQRGDGRQPARGSTATSSQQQQQRPTTHAVDSTVTSSATAAAGGADLQRFQHFQNLLFQRAATSASTATTATAAAHPQSAQPLRAASSADAEPSGIATHRAANNATNASVQQQFRPLSAQQQQSECPLSMGYL